MAETLREFLGRREREVTAQIAAIRGHLIPLERELAEIKSAKGSMAFADQSARLLHSGEVTAIVNELAAPAMSKKFAGMTIKELAIQALLDAFPGGANPAQLREFIIDAYGREIEQGSLRSQIHRLKASGVLEGNALTENWNLTPEARRRYLRYDHPSSRAAMKELKDEELSDE